ncbi:MAG: hypothetical protein KJ069_15560 [Anaerolineae bacterium]|nr:hypothetical protein [Anaerolineae bacterium]
MDKIEFKIKDKHKYPEIEIFINEKDFIVVLRDHEMPFAETEGHPNIAGSYMGLQPHLVLPPSRHFFGDPDPNYDDYHDIDGKTAVLVCGRCRTSVCWPLLVKIIIMEEMIVWKDFSQPHRKDSWKYDLFGPFEFDRTQYEMALEHAGKEFAS